jgi:hypothetical protein
VGVSAVQNDEKIVQFLMNTGILATLAVVRGHRIILLKNDWQQCVVEPAVWFRRLGTIPEHFRVNVSP